MESLAESMPEQATMPTSDERYSKGRPPAA